jgi:hypothetical protein
VASKGTPYQGRDLIIAPRVYTGLSLIAYTNAQDSLSDTSVYADLVQPAGSGYAPIALSGSWASSNGVVTYDHGTPDDPNWENTHATNNWSLPVTGVAIIDASNRLLHFHDLSNGPVTMTPAKKLVVNLSTLVAP